MNSIRKEFKDVIRTGQGHGKVWFVDWDHLPKIFDTYCDCIYFKPKNEGYEFSFGQANLFQKNIPDLSITRTPPSLVKMLGKYGGPAHVRFCYMAICFEAD